MSNDRIIGRVLSVDNYRVCIKLDDSCRGAYKSGVNDIYEVSRINSYLIIPVGSDRVVALITRVSMKEETEFDKHTSSISLPSSARYISATLLGTIVGNRNDEKFVQGVYNFPTLDNPVWYVTEKDLYHIFNDNQNTETIEYESDYYLPIGKSPVFSDYTVKICPDQLFVKHTAILGNTGSGKSCTLTSIIRNLFRYNYKGQKLQNAHIVIFDTNGEYKSAFIPDESDYQGIDGTRQELDNINAYYYGGNEKVKVPYWFLNWADFRDLLKPSDGVQAPVLNRAIGLAKNEQECNANTILPINLRTEVENILSYTSDDLKKRTWEGGKWIWKKGNEIENIGYAVHRYDNQLGDLIIELSSQESFNNANKQQPIREKIKDRLASLHIIEIEKQITNEQNIDLPKWFDYQEICTKFINAAIALEEKNQNKISEYVSTLRLRMNSFLNDKRIAIPLMLKGSKEANKNILAQFIAFILGDFKRFYSDDKTRSFIHEYDNSIPEIEKSKTNQISIIDMSLLPFEVLETVTALLGRIILEFVSHFLPEERGRFPIVLVLEEAQNYIAEKKESVTKTVFERISREGRKYGISLIVCSQRPSELSKTVLSQCNSFIIHRLQNPEDQKYIRGLVSSANADILDQLPIIPPQYAIISGDCVRTPIQVKIDDVFPTPNSQNPRFIERWLSDMIIPYEDTCNRWLSNNTNTEKSNDNI